MDHHAAVATRSGVSEKEPLGLLPLAEATGRMMSLLSQSQIRHQLECQVRYFLSCKLLNFPNNRGSGDEHEFFEDGGAYNGYELQRLYRSVPFGFGDDGRLRSSPNFLKPVGHQPRIANTLAFKATVSLVLGWLKAHELMHSAGVLCPEVSMRETEVLSEEECLSVLHLPQTLLEDSGTLPAAHDIRGSLLDRLLAFTTEGGSHAAARNSTNLGWKTNNSASVAECRVASAGGSSEKLKKGATSAPHLTTTVRANSVRGRPGLRPVACAFSCRPRAFAKRSLYPCSHAKASKRAKCRVKGTRWEEEATTQLQCLAAQLRRLELRDCSDKLFAASSETRHMVEQRLASIEAEHHARISQLQKAVLQTAESREAEREASMVEARAAMQEAQRRLQILLHQQEKTGRVISKRARNVTAREARLIDREERLLRGGVFHPRQDYTLGKNEQNEVLAQENASLRSQLLTAKSQVDALQQHVHRLHLEREMLPQLIEGQVECEHAAACIEPRRRTSSPFLHQGGTDGQAAVQAREQECERRVARLTEELQRSTEQIKSKDAEFKLLVAELESARHKSAQAEKRMKRLQKLYEAARSVCAQQRQLASSVSLSLNSMGVVLEPITDVAGHDLPWISGKENGMSTCETTHPVVGWRSNKRADGRCMLPQRWPHAVEVLGTHYWETKRCLPCTTHLPKSHPAAMEEAAPLHVGLGRFGARSSKTHAHLPGLPTQCCHSGRTTELYSETLHGGNGILFSPGSPEKEPQEGSIAAELPGRPDRLRGECISTLAAATRVEIEPVGAAPCAVDEKRSWAFIERSRHAASLDCAALSTSDPPPCAVTQCTSALGSALTGREASEDPRGTSPSRNNRRCSIGIHRASGLSPEPSPRTQRPDTLQCSSDRGGAPKANPPTVPGGTISPRPGRHCGNACPLKVPPQFDPVANCKKRRAPLDPPTYQTNNSAEAAAEDTAAGEECRNAQAISANGSPGSCMLSMEATHLSCVGEAGAAGTRKSVPQVVAAPASPSVSEQPDTNPLSDSQAKRLLGTELTDVSSHQPSEHALAILEPPADKPPVASTQNFPSVALGRDSRSERGSPSAVQGSDEHASADPRGQSPWAEASIASSLPESPKGLSNFPSLSCPVASAVEGFTAPSASAIDSPGCWIALPREHIFPSESATSFSPSDNDWLACVSPSSTSANPDTINKAQYASTKPDVTPEMGTRTVM